MSFKILCKLIIIVYVTTVTIKSSYGNTWSTAPLVTLKKCCSTTKKDFLILCQRQRQRHQQRQENRKTITTYACSMKINPNQLEE